MWCVEIVVPEAQPIVALVICENEDDIPRPTGALGNDQVCGSHNPDKNQPSDATYSGLSSHSGALSAAQALAAASYWYLGVAPEARRPVRISSNTWLNRDSGRHPV